MNHDKKQNTLLVCTDFQDQNKRGRANFISKGLLFPEFKFELKERKFMTIEEIETLSSLVMDNITNLRVPEMLPATEDALGLVYKLRREL
jgi:hypothetical protein